ncbi:MAG: biotin transporter BioY [Butyrivibrio sp.]|nr:biotin transporter BioY [Butyrivibrio sp.]
MSEHNNKTKRLVISALFAALLCIGAYISVPLPIPGAPHITMINFVLFIIALLFSVSESFLIVAVWMLLGIVGIPVFIGGKGGVGYLIQPWGAYTWAFIIVAIILPLIRGKSYNRIRYTISALIGVLIIDIVGMLYLMAMSHYDLKTGLAMGFVPFIPLDVIKAVVAAQIIPAFNRVVSWEK